MSDVFGVNRSFGLNIVINDLACEKYLNPKSLREYACLNRSWLNGIEVWLSEKLGFSIEIFTSIQKEFLKINVDSNAYVVGDTIYMSTYDYNNFKKALIK